MLLRQFIQHFSYFDYEDTILFFNKGIQVITVHSFSKSQLAEQNDATVALSGYSNKTFFLSFCIFKQV